MKIDALVGRLTGRAVERPGPPHPDRMWDWVIDKLSKRSVRAKHVLAPPGFGLSFPGVREYDPAGRLSDALLSSTRLIALHKDHVDTLDFPDLLQIMTRFEPVQGNPVFVLLRRRPEVGWADHVEALGERLRRAAEQRSSTRVAAELTYARLVATDRGPPAEPGSVGLTSALCRQGDFALDSYRYWAAAIGEKPRYHRKQWEFFFIAQALSERSKFGQGRAGLGFGVGREPLPALFAGRGCAVLATDQSAEGAERGGWVQTAQHTTSLNALRRPDICRPSVFDAAVSFRPVDMNSIPEDLSGKFDFCWSACSLEHLGSIEAGLRFVERSIDTLVPGGLAVHTTEFNLSSNDATLESQDLSLFRRRDIEELARRLSARGHKLAAIDWSRGEGYVDGYIDAPPYRTEEPHLKLSIAPYECTSIGLIIERGAG